MEGWSFWPDPMSSMAVYGTGETMFNTDMTFNAFEGDSSLKIWGLYSGGTNMENNALLSEINKGNINNQIDYNDYSRLNDLLNIQLENWEKNQNEINKITKNVRSNE